MPEVVLIGRVHDAADAAADRLLDGCTVALQKFDTDTLHAIADRRAEINPGDEGDWMRKMILGYIEVWR